MKHPFARDDSLAEQIREAKTQRSLRRKFIAAHCIGILGTLTLVAVLFYALSIH